MTKNDIFFKTLVFIACLLPLTFLITNFFLQKLGANPVETIIRDTGLWSLRFLMMTLCITPLRKLVGWQWGMKIRRMLGLYAFFYACLHFTAYLWFEEFFDFAAIWTDVMERPFITMGFITFVLMIPLAITSTHAMIKKLGGKRWQQLHRLVYLIAITSILHFWWMADSKGVLTTPIIYAVIIAILLLMRIFFLKKSSKFLGK